MQILSTHDATEWQAGTFGGTWLNYDVYASPTTGDPALVPLSAGTLTPVQHAGDQLLSGGIASGSSGNAWTVHNAYLTTDQTSDTLSFTPPSTTLYVDIVTTSALYPDMIDSRGLGWPASSDGMAGQDSTTGPLRVSEIRGGTVAIVSIDGVFAGFINSARGFQSTRFSLDGLSAHTVTLLNTGASTAGDDVKRLTLVGVVYTQGSTGMGRMWTSPVLDGGDPLATWVGADWEQAAPGTVFGLTFTCGQTPIPDDTWQSYAIPVLSTLPGPQGPVPFTLQGVPHGRAAFLAPTGLPAIVRARYAQVVFSLVASLATPAANGSTVPWIRELDIYTSLPETETLTLLRLPPTLRGPSIIAEQSAKGAVLAKLHADALQLVSSYSIGGARSIYLQRYGQDQDLPQAPGEGQAAYAARLQAASIGKAQGPASGFIVGQVSSYCGAPVQITSYGSPSRPWHYTLTFPPIWPNPVSKAQITTFVQTINIAGHIPAIVWTS